MPYLIIDRAHTMHPAPGSNLRAAIEVFNDTHIAATDMVIEALICTHCHCYIKPPLPDWMSYTSSRYLSFCNCL